MKKANPREVLLTFDVEGPASSEDFIDDKTLAALGHTLRLLEKYKLRAILFITGSVTKDLDRCPEVLEMMRKHEIGYQASSHSVKPRIFEYTDVKSYEEAIQASLERETSNIDPRTGKIKGEGGILSLREAFHGKNINSFRAPFLSWSPPHLEALKQLGFQFDFSADVDNVPTLYRGTTFYPYPIQVDSRTNALGLVDTKPTLTRAGMFTAFLPTAILRKACTVLMIHPAVLAGQRPEHAASRFVFLEFLFSQLAMWRKMGRIDVTPSLKDGKKCLYSDQVDFKMVYAISMWAPRRLFDCRPRFLLSHFRRFFAPPTLG